MNPNYIRPIALCVFLREGRIFVAEYADPSKDGVFYRPLGGTIEFGEHSRDTVVREIQEEAGAAVTGVKYLATIENIFTYRGEAGHEIVMMYTADFTDPAIYDLPVLNGWEANGSPLKAVWKPLADFTGADAPPLYPTGLLQILVDQN